MIESPKALVSSYLISDLLVACIGQANKLTLIGPFNLDLLFLIMGLINTACHECLPKKTKVIQYWLQKDYPKDGVLQFKGE